MKDIIYSTNNFTKKFKFFSVIGKNVLIKKLVNTLDKKYGDIFIPQSINKNQAFGIGQVLELGKDQEIIESGVKVGDYILYDYFSVYHDNPDIVVTKVENIILILSEEEKNIMLSNCVLNG